MLEIDRVETTEDRATYALSGEVTVDQLERIEALIQDAVERNRGVTLDLQHVWRVERDAAFLLAYHACQPNNRVRIVGVPGGLLEWLRTVVDEAPKSETSRGVREGGDVWKS
jgi:ABC-type transporter Mla MlaB component